MATILDEIRAHKEIELAERQARRPLREVEASCIGLPATRGLRRVLSQPGMQILAAVKRRSPAKGDLKLGANAPELAETYFAGGAAGVSVLTDERFFSGADQDLTDVRSRVVGPLLRKDFTISDYQIFEARALGADAVLLIASLLTDQQLREYLATAARLSLDALVETHTTEEVARALDAGATLIGVNNRNLANFTVDLATTEQLAPLVPSGVILVSESGIMSRADVERVERAGAHAVLVGEALVTAPDPAEKIRELLGL